MADVDLNAIIAQGRGTTADAIRKREQELIIAGIEDEKSARKRAIADVAKYQQAENEKTRRRVLKDINDEQKQRLLLEKNLTKEQQKELQSFYATKRQLRQAEHQAEIERIKQETEIEQDATKRAAKQKELSRKESLEKWKQGMEQVAANTINSAVRAGENAVEQAAKVYNEYMSRVNTRLLGSSSQQDVFSGMTNLIKSNLAASPYVRQTAVLEKLNKLVSEGIAYNVEQRAFLAAVSDKIATTFDVANGTLLQLIRLQRADSTTARMGMEASITEYLNAAYRDTSYLNSTYDQVSSLLYEATAQQDRSGGVEFEYVVQKWLGSLSSLGATNELVQNIAQGLGYLGSGNISALSSNSALQNLMLMGASRAGLPYGTLLTEGLDASNTNKLLAGIVNYLGDIASSGNKVVQSEYARLFGLSMSDLVAIRSLKAQDIKDITDSLLSYGQAVAVVNSRLSTMSDRMHISEKIDTLLDNAMFNIGSNVAGSVVGYATWRIADLVEQVTGGIPIPFIETMFGGIDTKLTFEKAIKTGIVGIAAIPALFTALGSLTRGAGTALFDAEGNTLWNAKDIITRGQGLSPIQSGLQMTTSQSAVIGNTSAEDWKSATFASATEESKTISGDEDAEANEQKRTLNIIAANLLGQDWGGESGTGGYLDLINGNVRMIYELLDTRLSTPLTSVESANNGGGLSF